MEVKRYFAQERRREWERTMVNLADGKFKGHSLEEFCQMVLLPDVESAWRSYTFDYLEDALGVKHAYTQVGWLMLTSESYTINTAIMQSTEMYFCRRRKRNRSLLFPAGRDGEEQVRKGWYCRRRASVRQQTGNRLETGQQGIRCGTGKIVHLSSEIPKNYHNTAQTAEGRALHQDWERKIVLRYGRMRQRFRTKKMEDQLGYWQMHGEEGKVKKWHLQTDETNRRGNSTGVNPAEFSSSMEVKLIRS